MSAPAFAQIAQLARITSPTSPMTLAFSTQNLTPGSYLLAYVWLENSTTITPTLTDNSSGGSNTWTQLTSGTFTALGTMYVFGAPNLNGGGQKPTVSAAFTGSPSVGIIEIAEYTSVNLGAPLDVTSIYFQNDSMATGNTYNAGPITTLQANDLVVLIGHIVANSTTITAGGTQTLRGVDASANNFRTILVDMPAAVAGTFTPSVTIMGGAGTQSMDVFTLALAPAPAVATSTFSPTAGSYAGSQSVTVLNANSALSGFAMYYTTDGTIPTTGSTLYSGPITVSVSETVKVLAVATGYVNSAIASASYVIGGGGAVGWSPVDSRQAVPGFGPSANTGIVDEQGNVIYSAQKPPFTGNSQVSDNSAIPPVDSRTVGAPVDSRVSIPENSRVAPPFGGVGEP